MATPVARERWLEIAKDLLSLPTAPLHEDAVADWLRAFAEKRRLPMRQDRWGNLLIHYRCGSAHAKRARLLVFGAHMDHPGFVAVRMQKSGALLAQWRGYVPPQLFAGARVRFFSDGRWVRGVVISVAGGPHRTGKPRSARVRMREPVPPGSVGMWDFPDPYVRDGRLYARGHDCVAGVAALACLLDEAHRDRRAGEFYAFFTRCEEGGFLGAIGAAKSRTLPKRSIVVALETSKALPNARLGDGVVVRVGDRSGIFTPWVSAWLDAVAGRLARRDKAFRFQRRLMDGGTCESSVYMSYGYEAGGLCLPLQNYHNVDWERKRLRPECIDVRDYEALVRLLVACVRRLPSRMEAENRERWEGLFRRLGGAALDKARPADALVPRTWPMCTCKLRPHPARPAGSTVQRGRPGAS